MGFYSGCVVFGDDQIAAWTDCSEMLAAVRCYEVVRYGPADRGDEDPDQVECAVSGSPVPRNTAIRVFAGLIDRSKCTS